MHYNYKPVPFLYIQYLHYGDTYHYVLFMKLTTNITAADLKKSVTVSEWKEKYEGEWNL